MPTDPALLAALASPATYRGRPTVSVRETHASWVFLVGDRAYKVKKPLALAFLDYSTLARRHDACREELRVNAELAPDTYIAVRAIVNTGHGYGLAAEDAPDAVEYAVEMRRFRESDTLAGRIAAGTLTRTLVAAVARRLADFHRAAPVVDGWGPGQALAAWRENVEELRQLAHPSAWALDAAAAFGEAFVAAHAPEMQRRALLGLARDGHGDLRCEHVLGAPAVRIVDRIEFDPRLRRTDVACDLAFLAMDLEAHGQAWAARELVDAYSHAGISPGSEALRSFYGAERALVRAKVALIAAAERDGEAHERALAEAHALWALAERLCWRARGPVAVVVCGPAASGKSTLAAALSARSGMPVVASDVIRKSAAGLAPTERARPEHYSARFTRTTYELLAREAQLALRRSGGAIVDATCRSRAERTLLLAGLRRPGLTLLVVRCEVPAAVAAERAARRQRDPARVSDATPAIAAAQLRSFDALDELPADSVLELRTDRPAEELVEEITRAVDLRLADRVHRGHGGVHGGRDGAGSPLTPGGPPSGSHEPPAHHESAAPFGGSRAIQPA